MRYIWLDVTTIFGWHRPAVGIVRVETECAGFALKNEIGQTRFCRFDASDKRYVEVPAEEVREVLARILMKRPSNFVVTPPANSSVPPVMSTEQSFIALVRRMIGMLPQGWRARVFNFAANRKSAYQAAVRSYREARLAIHEFLQPASGCRFVPEMSSGKSSATSMHAVPFAKDDIYVSLGLDWDQKDLMYLFSQKRDVGFKVLLFCYDIIPVKFPHLCVGDVAAKFAKYFANLAWCADKVLCISECTRSDLIQLLTDLGTPIPPMDVIKLGCDIQSQTADDATQDIVDLIGCRYILFVSTIERRKNHETLYRAYTRLVDRGMSNLPLMVFVGMPGWGVNDLMADLRLDPRIQPYIRILNHVTDSDLACLYKNAYFTVYPSLYEGWGLPVAESLAYGKFCLASDVASIPEVGGELIEYLDPWDVPAWATRIQWYIEHPEDLSAKEQRIRNEFMTTTWISCAASIVETTLEKDKSNEFAAENLGKISFKRAKINAKQEYI